MYRRVDMAPGRRRGCRPASPKPIWIGILTRSDSATIGTLHFIFVCQFFDFVQENPTNDSYSPIHCEDDRIEPETQTVFFPHVSVFIFLYSTVCRLVWHMAAATRTTEWWGPAYRGMSRVDADAQ